MRSEPTAIIELIRFVAIIASTFGFAISADEQAGLVAGIGGALAAVSILLAIVNRLRVFSPATAESLVDRAFRAGRMGTPQPDVNPPGK